MVISLFLFAWLGIGLIATAATSSRGALADAIFVLTWPVHLLRYLAGRE